MTLNNPHTIMTTLEILTEVEAGRMSPGVALELLEPTKAALEIGKVYSLAGSDGRFEYIGPEEDRILFKLVTENHNDWAIRTDGLIPFWNILSHKFVEVGTLIIKKIK